MSKLSSFLESSSSETITPAIKRTANKIAAILGAAVAIAEDQLHSTNAEHVWRVYEQICDKLPKEEQASALSSFSSVDTSE